MSIYIKKYQVDDKGVRKKQYQMVALYVDDLIIASTKHLLTSLEGVFESRFKMKLNKIKQILGMGVHYDKIATLFMLLNNSTSKNLLNNLTSMVSALSAHQWMIECSTLSLRCPKQDQLKQFR
jgi:hypothetical protein